MPPWWWLNDQQAATTRKRTPSGMMVVEHRPLRPPVHRLPTPWPAPRINVQLDEAELARIAERLGASDQKAQAAPIEEWQAQFRELRAEAGVTTNDGDPSYSPEPTERELWNFCQAVVRDPRVLQDWPPMIYFLARAYCEQIPRPNLSGPDVARYVNRLIREEGLRVGKAYERVAKATGKTVGAVKTSHLRYKGTL